MMLGWLKRRTNEDTIANDTALDSVRYVIVDTELTSLDNRTNRLLSLGAIAMNGSRILLGEQMYRVVNPGVDVPAKGVPIHKLRPADVEDGSAPAEVLREFRTFIEGAVLVGHFAEIDIEILRKELAGSGQELSNPAICTARVYRWIVQNQQYSEDQFRKLEDVDLASLAKIYGLGSYKAHHALDDAFMTARLWQKLMHTLNSMKVRTLGHALKIGKI